MRCRSRYRDDLVAKGSLFRVLAMPPGPGAAAVPVGAERAVAFNRGLALVGFASDGNVVDRGSVVQLSYYWTATAPMNRDLSAVTLFFDAGVGRRASMASRRGRSCEPSARVCGRPRLGEPARSSASRTSRSYPDNRGRRVRLRISAYVPPPATRRRARRPADSPQSDGSPFDSP